VLVSALVRGEWFLAPVPPRERAMLAFAVTITEDPTRVSPATLDDLRAHGFDDTAILQMTMIASWFNYINRMADALGVGRD
jgi:uncharacterized peroxidase-related enzyme